MDYPVPVIIYNAVKICIKDLPKMTVAEKNILFNLLF
jgi:hypothetical protein